MRSKIAIATTIAMLLGGSAHGAVTDPIIPGLSDKVYQTKSAKYVLNDDDVETIKEAISVYTMSVSCDIGVTKSSTKVQREKALNKAKDVCSLAKDYASTATFSSKTFITTRSKSNKVTLTVISKDVPDRYPYFSKGFAVKHSIQHTRKPARSDWVVEIYGPAGDAPHLTKDGTLLRTGKRVVSHYLCQKSLSDKIFETLPNSWDSCTKLRRGYLVVTESLVGQWVRSVATYSNDIGTIQLYNEFQLKLP